VAVLSRSDAVIQGAQAIVPGSVLTNDTAATPNCSKVIEAGLARYGGDAWQHAPKVSIVRGDTCSSPCLCGGHLELCIPQFRVVEFLSASIFGNATAEDVYPVPVGFAAKPCRAEYVDDVGFELVGIVDHVFFELHNDGDISTERLLEYFPQRFRRSLHRVVGAVR